MKRFMTNLKATNFATFIPIKSTASPNALSSTVTPNNLTTPHTTCLQPRYIVPPVPHPCPYDHIALLVTAEGLLLRPHIEGPIRPESHVRIGWGKAAKVEGLEGDGDGDGINWNECVIVYGIIGILELFTSIVLPLDVQCFLF